MSKKRFLLLVSTLFALACLAVINTVSADPPPPPCLTTDLCFEEAIKATNFTGAGDLAVDFITPGSNLDFGTASYDDGELRIKFGIGAGTFRETWTMNMGTGVQEIDLADFNNDGYTDIIATNSDQDRVLIRWGASGWNSATAWTTEDHPHYVTTGDLNNDDLPDFATGNKSAGDDSVTVRLRQAGGGFEAPTHYPVDDDFIGDVAFNDCDNDGDLDLFYSAVNTSSGNQEAFVYLRKNNGSGAFSASEAIDLNSQLPGVSAGAITFGDFNEDATSDFIVTSINHRLIYVPGATACSYDSPVIIGYISNPYSLETADMNGDGHLDVVVSHLLQTEISIYLGQGDGSFSGPYQPELTLDRTVRDIGVGDFNNDGLMDILYSEESGVWLLLAREENSPPWEPPWLELDDMWFAPTGAAQVEIVLDEVIISNIGSSGLDGVDIMLDSAILWSADYEIEGNLGSKLNFGAVANETATGSVQLVSAQSGMELWPVFNSTNYMIEYLLDDQVQLALTLPSNSPTPAAVIHWDQSWCMMNLPPPDPTDICPMTLQTYVEGSGGRLFGDSLLWYDGFVIDDAYVTAADGNLVMADRIRLAEIYDWPGGYLSHGISRVEVRAAATETVTANEIIVVSAEPPLPDQGGSSLRSWNNQNGPYLTVFDLDTAEFLPFATSFDTSGNAIGAGEYINGLSYMIDEANNVYVVDDDGNLQNQYMATPPPNGETYSGMALDPTDGTLYAVSTNMSTSHLYIFAAAQGNAELVGPVSGSPAMSAIAIDGNGDLYGYDIVSDSFLQIDPATGNTTNAVPLPFNAELEQGMAYDPATGLLTMLAYNGDTLRGELWTVDTSNPAMPIFNFVEVLGVVSPGGSNQLTWAGIDLGINGENRVYMPVVLRTD